MKLTISVTEEDIRNGVPTETSCPIACAANRALDEAGLRGPIDNRRSVGVNPYSEVDGTGIFVLSAYGGCVCKVRHGDIPSCLFEWAMDFDHWCAQDRRDECPVCPATFEVDVPLEVA